LASIKDVARLAGVSVSTVSRVLGGTGPVDEDTRRKVDKAIAVIDYRPNLLAQGLRSKKGNVIGLVVPESPHETFASFVEHTERACAALGYNLVVGNTSGQPDVEATFIDSLLRRHVDGIIFSRVSDRSQVLNIIEKWNTPAVTIDRAVDRENVPTIVIDNFRAGQIAAKHLISLGHLRFGVITGPQDIAISRERLKGFVSTVEQHGLTLMARNIFEGDFKFESGLAAGQAFVDRNLDITALWGENDLMAIGAMNVLLRSGLRVPGDVSVMGMDDANIARMIVPALTTVTQPFEEMCRKAVELIVAIKNGLPVDNKRIVLQPDIVVRESTGRLVRVGRVANTSPRSSP